MVKQGVGGEAKGRLEKVLVERKEKLRGLVEAGVDPYVTKFERSHLACDMKRVKEGGEVRVGGRVMGWREHGGAIFADLVDVSGKIQLYFQEDRLGKEKFGSLKRIDLGDFMGVTGEKFVTEAGEVTVRVGDFWLLTKAVRPLPSVWHGLKDVEERYRQRYVDLMLNPEVRRVFEVRTQILSLFREFMDKRGFLEVETPALQPIYGGASARPFTTHHNTLDTDLYLRISDELYLKRLVVGGFEKVYEICKDFRNEGMDRWHNPEFTLMEFYWAYADYEDLMKMTEEMLSWIAKEVTGSYQVKYGDKVYDLTPPWPRVNLRDQILEDMGIDIDKVREEKELLAEIKKGKVKVELGGVVGWAALVDELFKKASRPSISGPVFLKDYPYELKPLAKRKADDLTKTANFQLVLAGTEMLNAYNELNDPEDQRKRWEEEMGLAKRGLAEYQVLDEDYIRALEYGMPPTAGWGLGVDRWVAFLTDQHAVKDVILFPTLKPERK